MRSGDWGVRHVSRGEREEIEGRKVRDGGAEGHVSRGERCLTARLNEEWRELNRSFEW